MDLLVDKTDNLNQQAFQFKKKSTQLKRAMWWKNTKLMIILVLVCIVSRLPLAFFLPSTDFHLPPSFLPSFASFFDDFSLSFS